MLPFFLSLLTMFLAPTGIAIAAQPAPVVAPAATTGFDWLGGTWKSGGLEMTCAVSGAGAACREEGKSGPMQGAAADLTFAVTGEITQLTVALPTIPASVFTGIAREGQSATFEMKTPNGVARLRFTRTGDELKVERGNGEGWGSAMVYQRG